MKPTMNSRLSILLNDLKRNLHIKLRASSFDLVYSKKLIFLLSCAIYMCNLFQTMMTTYELKWPDRTND